MTLIVEDGTGIEGAEAYISVADADSFYAKEPRGEFWAQLSTSDKEKLLRQAARILDQECRWLGYKADVDYALEWPRANARRESPTVFGVTTGYANLIEGDYYADDEVPVAVQRANADLAGHLHKRDRYAETEKPVSGVSSAKGSRSYGRPERIGGQILPPSTFALIRRLCDAVSRELRRIA